MVIAKQNAAKGTGTKQNGMYLFKSGLLTCVLDLENARKTIRPNGIGEFLEANSFISIDIKLLESSERKYSTQWPMSFLKCFSLGIQQSDSRHCKTRYKASSYCSGYLSPLLNHQKEGSTQ